MFSQSYLSKESEPIVKSFILNKNVSIVNNEFADEKEKFIFKEYRKLDASEVKNLKVSFPKYLMVDTKAKLGKKVRQEITAKTIYTDLKFDFTDAPHIVFEDLSNSIDNTFFYRKYIFSDLVVQKYVTEKTNQIFYLCKLNRQGVIVYGVFMEADLTDSNKQQNYKLVADGNKILQLDNVKANSKEYLKGYFKKVFPDDEIYLYDVEYDVSILNSDKKAKFFTTAISNNKKENLTLEDFHTTTKHRPIAFKYKTSLNIYELLLSPVTIDSITFIKGLYYGDSDGQDILINNEAKLIGQNLTNFSKFDSLYFVKKLNDPTYLKTLKKEPYILTFRENEYGNIEFGFYYEIRGKRGDAELSLETKDNEVTFNYIPKSSAYPNFEPASIRRKFDTRIDSLNFKFVFVDPLLLVGEQRFNNNYYFQKDFRDLISFKANECVIKLQRYYNDIKENTKKNQKDIKDKEILYTKYGKKYVDLAFAGNIVVGMPEDLIVLPLQLWKITNRSKYQNGYRIYCYSMLDSSAKLTVIVTNKKVSYVNY
jgi:hypothetical protein